jgi:hypothetical protein
LTFAVPLLDVVITTEISHSSTRHPNLTIALARFQVRAALDGTIAGSSEVARKEISVKTAAYSNIWMHVLGELHNSLADCEAGTVLTLSSLILHCS